MISIYCTTVLIRLLSFVQLLSVILLCWCYVTYIIVCMSTYMCTHLSCVVSQSGLMTDTDVMLYEKHILEKDFC